MSRSRRPLLPLGVGVVGALLLAAAALLLPFDVRNSATAGYNPTLDPKRGIAVTGRRIAINYPNLHRIDLDLRAYTRAPRYDLRIHIRRAAPGASDVRVIPLGVAGDDIWHEKGDFADPFTKLHFEPIVDSAGKRYEVWVERGPRNRDDIVTIWSIKTYSRVTGRDVLGALLDNPPGTAAAGFVRVVLIVLLVGVVGAFGWLLGGVVALVISAGGALRAIDDQAGGRAPPVAMARGRWYTLSRFARWPFRPLPFGACRPSR